MQVGKFEQRSTRVPEDAPGKIGRAYPTTPKFTIDVRTNILVRQRMHDRHQTMLGDHISNMLRRVMRVGVCIG